MRLNRWLLRIFAAVMVVRAHAAGPETAEFFDVAEIRAAEAALVEALQSPDPTAWVYFYTDDAILVEPDAPAIQGRQALLEMARSMKPLSSVVISPVRTDGRATLAYVYGHASWVNGRPPHAGSTSNVRFVIVWRREADGKWRVAQEIFTTDAPDK